jgi:alpha-glucosidase (family GH31 glycosyl hydrolase)
VVSIVPVALVVAVVLSAPVPATASPGASTSDTSPVDLATPVDMADGMAHRSAIVRSGDARIEVLSPTLLRLEYSPSGTFENRPTVNALNRRMPVPPYTVHRAGGWLTLRTSRATLRYKVGSGPFTVTNTSLRFEDGRAMTTVHPTWEWECPFDQVCQAGAAVLSGKATINYSLTGYDTSPFGFVSDLYHPGDGATWNVLGAPAGPARLTLRYSNTVDPIVAPGPKTLALVIDGHQVSTLVAAQTTEADPWSTLTTTASLVAGTNAVEVACAPGESCNVELDSLSIGPAGDPAPVTAPTDPLGGWIRGFDTFTYPPNGECAPGTSGATCQVSIEPVHTDGLLDKAGWRLLDDTQSAQWTSEGWVQPRSRGGDVEDGYLFAYGHDYAGALSTLARLTGSAPLLPRSIFGVWYSDYTPYTSADIEDTIYPAFQKNQVPLNTLSLDTDWKAPNDWDGWEWNTGLFPDPSAFLTWARTHGVDVTLNIHSSIDDHDPELPEAERIAGTPLASSSCSAGPCKVWDWSTVSQAESNFALQQSLQKQGVSFFWLDWCCDESVVSMPGLTPDSWIDHLYAQEMVNQGQRGFVLARIGSSNDDPVEVYPAGPWSDHTSTIAFTGDAWATWNTLTQEVALTPDEATIGEPYVSDDIGSFLGTPPLGAPDSADLYDRWVQWGTFAPILRLHSQNEARLPWQYPQPVQGITESFLRLREALIPYTYTLADQAHDDGLPMTRPLYLDYPDQAAAYDHPDEYLFGSDMLVAPVTSPGDVADTTVWFPPGRWVDYFTGATFTGPATTTMAVPLNRMPVFVRAGGIIPEQSSSTKTTTAIPRQMVLKVFSGSRGTFRLYGDSGTGLGYTKGQSTETTITDSVGSAGATTAAQVTVGAARGHYDGEPSAVSYRLEMVDLTEPTAVTLDGTRLHRRTSTSDAPGWSYQASTATAVVTTGSMSTAHSFTVTASGARPVNRSEP